MGCVLVLPPGKVVSCNINSGFWEEDTEQPSSDVHAEVNAVTYCARNGIKTEGATAYITMPPCRRCFTVLVSAGVQRIVTRQAYPKDEKYSIRNVASVRGVILDSIWTSQEQSDRVEMFVRKRMGSVHNNSDLDRAAEKKQS